MFHHSSFVNSLKNTSSCVHVQRHKVTYSFSNSSYRLSQNIISHYVQYTAFISLYHPSNNKASKQPLTSCIFLQTPKPCPASILSTCFEHSGYWKHDSILQMNPYAALSADTQLVPFRLSVYTISRNPLYLLKIYPDHSGPMLTGKSQGCLSVTMTTHHNVTTVVHIIIPCIQHRNSRLYQN